MSKHLTTVSFPQDEETKGSVRLNGSVSFDVSIDVDGPPERWVGAVQTAFSDVAKRWLVDVLKEARSEFDAQTESSVKSAPSLADDETEESQAPRPVTASSLAEDLIAGFGPLRSHLGDEATSQVAEEEQKKRAAICQTREFPQVSSSETELAVTRDDTVEEKIPVVSETAAAEPAEPESVEPVELVEPVEPAEPVELVEPVEPVSDETEPSVMVSPELTFAPGLDEDSDGVFFADVPVTENVSTEHSHASIRVKNNSDVETRDYTPTERPTSLDKTSPANEVVESNGEWFSDRDIDGFVEEAKDSFEEEDSDALIAALPSLNQKIGNAPTGRVPRPPAPRPAKFSERAPTGTALARLQKRLRAQRRRED